MIQRIQSIFLLLAAISMTVFMFFPLWEVQGADAENLQLTAFYLTELSQGVQNQTTTFYLAILGACSIALSIFSLVSFKDRIKQIKLNAFNSIIVSVTAAVIVYWVIKTEDIIPNATARDPKIGFMMLILVIVFNRLATTFIRKDEKLVKDADRLR